MGKWFCVTAHLMARFGPPHMDTRSAGLAMVHEQAAGEAFIERGNWTVDSAGNIFPARVSLRPLYTPGMQRIRA